MKFLRSNFQVILILITIVSLSACKAKKKVVQAPPPPPPVETQAAPVQPPPAPVKETPPPPPPPAPNYNFSNIQFEFNSGILKTESYPLLDKAAAEMKKDPTATFTLKGYASAEGTDAHNMELSVDRANSVKLYLVNTGVNAANLTAKGLVKATL